MSEVERYISTTLLPLASGWNRSVAPHTYVRASDYDALAAENERLRVKLMTIASADPRYQGIEWAKAHAAENDNMVWLKWKEAIDQHYQLRAELENARELLRLASECLEWSDRHGSRAMVAIREWLERKPCAEKQNPART